MEEGCIYKIGEKTQVIKLPEDFTAHEVKISQDQREVTILMRTLVKACPQK